MEDLELSPAPYKSSVSPLCIQQDFKKPRKKTMPAFFGLEEQGRCCSTTPTTVDAADASILPPPSRRPPLPPTPDSVTGPSTHAAAGFGSDAPSAGTPTAPPSSSEQHGGRRGGPATALAEELSARLRLDDESGDGSEEDEPAVASPARSFASDFGDEAERVLESLTVSKGREKEEEREGEKQGRTSLLSMFPFARFFSFGVAKGKKKLNLETSFFLSFSLDQTGVRVPSPSFMPPQEAFLGRERRRRRRRCVGVFRSSSCFWFRFCLCRRCPKAPSATARGAGGGSRSSSSSGPGPAPPSAPPPPPRRHRRQLRHARVRRRLRDPS